ncbi:helix-turn-helix domain-containing protein [Streptomyces sp. NPDC101733]|uniref:AraC-like ligand-binding domain-containing protein n=1 Tax=unclassified Streptomyces TaxID=2593676 RepID=UPI00381D16C6
MTLTVEFPTDHRAAPRRPAPWEAALARHAMACTLTGERREGFSASCRVLDPGRLHLFALRCPPLTAHRSARLIRRADPEVLHVWLTLHGAITLNQERRELTATEGDLLVYDSSRPFTARSLPGARPDTASLVVQVPRAHLPLRSDVLDTASPAHVPGGTGTGALLRRHLEEMSRVATDHGAADASRLADAAIGLLVDVLSAPADPAAGGCGDPPRHALLLTQVHRFIRDHLGDPGLTPGTIAAAHHISLRHLHKLFEPEHTTVAEHIRTSRLQRLRHDLADPALTERPFRQLAAHWGLPDPAHAGRIFRTAFGVTPGHHRRLSRTAPPVR